MNIKLPKRWQRAIRLAVVTVFLLIVLLTYSYIIARHFFEAGYYEAIYPRQSALQTQVTIEDPAVRYRNKPPQSLYIHTN